MHVIELLKQIDNRLEQLNINETEYLCLDLRHRIITIKEDIEEWLE